MASLRKRPTDAVAATSGDDPEVAVSVETNAPPAPETSTPNDATEALKLQIGALRQSETNPTLEITIS